MVQISATVVTLNEEENIRNCLETLTWCDEIIIVDSHSDDNTVEIAREYTDKIFTYERTGYGDPAREKALEEASGEWICMIDADEMIPPHLADKLKQEVEDSKVDVVHAPRKNYIMGEWIDCAGWWPGYRSVLYKKSKAELSTQIHQFISFPESTTEKYISPKERNAIIHFNYTDISDFINRTNRYTTIESEQNEFRYYKLFLSPIFEFGYRFIIKSGYKKGFIGLYLCIFMSWYRFLALAKTWEQQKLGGEENMKRKYEKICNEIRSKNKDRI